MPLPIVNLYCPWKWHQAQKSGTSELQGKHSNILRIVDKEHSDQVSSGDQTSIDRDTDYIVQHAK